MTVFSFSDGTRLEQVSNVVWSCSLDGASATAREFSFEALVEGSLVASNTLVEVSAEWTYTNEDGAVTKRDVKSVVIAPVVPAKPTAPKMLSATTDGVTLEWEPVEGAALYRLYRGETAEAAQLRVGFFLNSPVKPLVIRVGNVYFCDRPRAGRALVKLPVL